MARPKGAVNRKTLEDAENDKRQKVHSCLMCRKMVKGWYCAGCREKKNAMYEPVVNRVNLMLGDE